MENSKNIENKQEHIFFKNIWLVDKYNFYEYMSVMLDWWVSLVEALETVSSRVKSPYFRQKIWELITYISYWDSFSKSMKKMPDVFNPSESSIIEAWETTGMLSESLMKLSDDVKKVADLRAKIKGALTYPIIILLFLVLSLIIVLTFVIPEIKPLFETVEVDLPTSTYLLIVISDFIINNLGLLFLAFATISVFVVWYKNTISWRKQIEEFIIGLPLVWIVYKNYLLAKISSTFWTLVGSGVSVIKALKLTGRTTDNSIYEGMFDDIIVKVSAWETIVKSMEQVDPDKYYFPNDYLQMLSVGERTANLENISKKLNNQYTKEVDYSIANLTKWIEPLAILVASTFVLWFAYAIVWAILKVTQSVG